MSKCDCRCRCDGLPEHVVTVDDRGQTHLLIRGRAVTAATRVEIVRDADRSEPFAPAYKVVAELPVEAVSVLGIEELARLRAEA